MVAYCLVFGVFFLTSDAMWMSKDIRIAGHVAKWRINHKKIYSKYEIRVCGMKTYKTNNK